MLVLKSRLDSTQHEIARLEADKAAMQAHIAALELSLDQERLRVQELEEAHNKGGGSELTHCMLDSLAQVEGIRSTVLHSYETIKAENGALTDINALFNTSAQSLQGISHDMEALNERMGQMSDRISGLSDTADSINKFVTTITSISDQTNLLALNAAIEAARAGDAGRGFSVVADEVRALANETNKSASEVAELVQGIIQSTKAAVGAVSELQENNTHLAGGIDELNNSYDQMITHCGNMKGTIEQASVQTFLQTVKLDHVVWKSEVYAVLCGKSNKRADELADHTSCRLGQWYQNTGDSNMRQKDAFVKLDRPHARVHSAGKEAIIAAREGNQTRIQQCLRDMETASEEVMQLLDRLGA